MKAMILAAGLGTRLRPFTLEHPKALYKVGNVTLLENAIRYLAQFGCTDIIINVHHFADQIVAYLNAHHNFGINITISDETNRLLDTGGGLKKAAWFFDGSEPFLIYNVDVITDLDLRLFYQYHLANQALVTLAVRQRTSNRYLLFDEEHQLCGWRHVQTGAKKMVRDTPVAYQLAFSGIQIVEPIVLHHFPPKEVFPLIDFYLHLAAQNLKVTYYDHTSDQWQDIGSMTVDKQ